MASRINLSENIGSRLRKQLTAPVRKFPNSPTYTAIGGNPDWF